MFAANGHRMLTSMSATEPGVDTPRPNWSDLGVNELPTRTATLLLADIEGLANKAIAQGFSSRCGRWNATSPMSTRSWA
jgi:hypothetical protein